MRGPRWNEHRVLKRQLTERGSIGMSTYYMGALEPRDWTRTPKAKNRAVTMRTLRRLKRQGFGL